MIIKIVEVYTDDNLYRTDSYEFDGNFELDQSNFDVHPVFGYFGEIEILANFSESGLTWL